MLIAGRYQLRDPIGRGAMGEVWRAFDEVAGRPVAVKLLLPQSGDSTATSRFRLEAQTAGRLNHPHVVGVLDFGEYEGGLFLVMELVEGDSLARVLASAGQLDAERVARIAAQAASGLAAAHLHGIVHRDIKPANLLLDAHGSVKIGDFGIARFVDDPGAALTATGQIVGTSLYLAPERALGQAAGPASDLYSLGCVLYQLLTGRTPFAAKTAVGVLHQHLDAIPVPPRDLGVVLPPAFESYLLGLLAKKPEDRPTAQQAAEWFATGSWRGRPEPLPDAMPVPPVLPLPGRSDVAEMGRVTTYRLATGTGTRARRGRRADRPDVRALDSHRRRLAAVLAGLVVFVAAVLVGMAWFSPDNSAPEAPSSGSTTGAASVSPAAPRPAESSAARHPEHGDEDHKGKDKH
ncbi:serine/threonine-protein kinase [Streptomyces sp. NPDC058964]|uniref:serine/threonine-protein kinase n=1 Tax=Streptomyces sp. NPDC058964 TaxID=3346681 RepID=UPI0036A7DC62